MMPRSTFFRETTSLGDSYTTSSDSPLSVTFNLCCQSSTTDYLVFPGSGICPRLLRRDYPPPIETSVPVALDEFEYVEEILEDNIDDWPLPFEKRKEFIDSVVKKTNETIRSMPSCDNTVQIHARVDVSFVNYDTNNETETEIVLDENDLLIEFLARLSMEESSYGMTPAAESSIESLQKNKYTTDDCSICFEQLLDGCDVTSMPCSHLFHTDCVERWLRTSRYFPLCRYEMR